MAIGFSGIRPAFRQAPFMAVLAYGFAFLLPSYVQASDRIAMAEIGPVRLGVPLYDVPSRMMAVGLSSLVRLEKADFSLDIVWLGANDKPSKGPPADGVDLFLLSSGTSNLPSANDVSNLLGVMKYGVISDQSNSSPQSGLLLANETLSASIVETMIDLAMQDRVILKSSRIDTASLTPNQALRDLPIPKHPGVERYLERHRVPKPSAIAGLPDNDLLPKKKSAALTDSSVSVGHAAALEERGQRRRSFMLYFDTAEAQLDRSDFRSVAEACEFAATLPNARFVIAGHTDTVGTDSDNQVLSKKRAQAVASAIRNDPRFRESLDVVEFGESQLAIATGDGVNEPKNRRVEISVVID